MSEPKMSRLVELLERVYEQGEILSDAENTEVGWLVGALKPAGIGQEMLDLAFSANLKRLGLEPVKGGRR
jgi:hypothetical protein